MQTPHGRIPSHDISREVNDETDQINPTDQTHQTSDTPHKGARTNYITHVTSKPAPSSAPFTNGGRGKTLIKYKTNGPEAIFFIASKTARTVDSFHHSCAPRTPRMNGTSTPSYTSPERPTHLARTLFAVGWNRSRVTLRPCPLRSIRGSVSVCVKPSSGIPQTFTVQSSEQLATSCSNASRVWRHE